MIEGLKTWKILISQLDIFRKNQLLFFKDFYLECCKPLANFELFMPLLLIFFLQVFF